MCSHFGPWHWPGPDANTMERYADEESAGRLFLSAPAFPTSSEVETQGFSNSRQSLRSPDTESQDPGPGMVFLAFSLRTTALTSSTYY